jgi:hypothetical protein
MATENTWRTRGKRTSVVALALVAILAGVAVAYFISTQNFANNYAKGGTLSVDQSGLPMDFTSATGDPNCHQPTGTADPDSCDTLFPVDATTASSAGTAAKKADFSITNNNPAATTYLLYASCPGCSDTTLADQADQLDQYNHLMINISDKAAAFPAGTIATLTGSTPKTYFEGHLADLTAAHPAVLKQLTSAGSQDYEVTMWLLNDPQNVQTQAVLSNWTFSVSARTPAPPAS